MDKEQKDLMARVLDMNEIELRACLLTIVKDTWELLLPRAEKNLIKTSIDAAYNPIRRTGVKI